MCLSQIDRIWEPPEKGGRYWKVFVYSQGGRWIGPIYNLSANGYRVGARYRARQTFVTIDDSEARYLSGYHCFRYKKHALEWAAISVIVPAWVRPVLAQRITCEGHQGAFPVVVAEVMTLLPVKGDPVEKSKPGRKKK